MNENVKKYITDLRNITQSAGFESLDSDSDSMMALDMLDSAETPEMLDMIENLAKNNPSLRKNINFRTALNMKRTQLSNAIKPSAGGVFGAKLGARSVESAAQQQYTVQVKRITANIAESLPAPIFGAAEISAGFDGLLPLPSGVTLTKLDFGMANGSLSFRNKLVLTYSDGTNPPDSIEITCKQLPYPTFLNQLLGTGQAVGLTRISLSDSTQVAQFSANLKLLIRTGAGRINSDNLSASASKSPEQFQQGIVDIKQGYQVDRYTTLVSEILPVVGFTVSYDIFAVATDRDKMQF